MNEWWVYCPDLLLRVCGVKYPQSTGRAAGRACLLSVQLPKVIGGQSSSKNEHGIAAAASLLQDSFQALTANPPLVSLLLQLLLLVNVLFLNKPLYGGGRKQSNHQACQQLSSRGFASAEQQKC